LANSPVGRVSLPYVGALDGLRAAAVVAVVAYHASLDQAPGGFFGVDVFFVISGYLVTSLFLARAPGASGPGRPETIEFWRRRLYRLVPASVGAVALTWVVFALLDVRSIGALTSEGLAALAYGANWFFLFHEQSYFETISSPSPFLHFWSLAVEAQFYLLWPLLLMAALRFGGRLSAFALAVSLAAISTLVVASLYDPLADPSRAYYGTDARMAGLLLGAAAAIVLRPGAHGHGFSGRRMRVAAEACGWLGLVVIAYLVTQVSEFDPFIYRGGFFLASTASLGVLLATLHGENSVARILALPPLRWVGERSYSIYLWHWPVFVLTQPQLSIELRSISLLLARLGATLILAELSYRLVENRFRAGRTPTLPRFEWGSGPYLQRPWARPAGVMAVGLLAIAVAGGLPMRVGLAGQSAPDFAAAADAWTDSGDLVAAPSTTTPTSPPASSTSPTSEPTPEPTPTLTADPDATPSPPLSPGSLVAQSATTATPTPTHAPVADTPDADADDPGSSTGSSSSVSDDEPASVTPEATPAADALGVTVTMIGDSVLLGAAPALAETLPGALVDAEVGRQFFSAPGVIEGLRARGALGQVVVIHLGANGPFTGEQFQAVMASLEDARAVIFVTVTVPRRWEGEVNDAIRSRTAGLPNVSVADWNSLSADQAAYFGSDGVHLTGTGRDAYAALVQQAVAAAVAASQPAGD